jgi:hypothetical protein
MASSGRNNSRYERHEAADSLREARTNPYHPGHAVDLAVQRHADAGANLLSLLEECIFRPMAQEKQAREDEQRRIECKWLGLCRLRGNTRYAGKEVAPVLLEQLLQYGTQFSGVSAGADPGPAVKQLDKLIGIFAPLMQQQKHTEVTVAHLRIRKHCLAQKKSAYTPGTDEHAARVATRAAAQREFDEAVTHLETINAEIHRLKKEHRVLNMVSPVVLKNMLTTLTSSINLHFAKCFDAPIAFSRSNRNEVHEILKHYKKAVSVFDQKLRALTAYCAQHYARISDLSDKHVVECIHSMEHAQSILKDLREAAKLYYFFH